MKINNSDDFGAALRARRKQLNYTQGDVAEVSGFSTSFISELENGKVTCELGKALYLANLLGLDIILNERE
ncbi:MAG: helix-turn-helix domain-containing protein [Lachnospiraceae bacterium]|nr:helix-turn-helix domain-containing protein [Lachnospiraceae bacterium]